MKEWTCIQVTHHNSIAEAVRLHQGACWKLHTYQAVGSPTMVNH